MNFCSVIAVDRQEMIQEPKLCITSIPNFLVDILLFTNNCSVLVIVYDDFLLTTSKLK